MEVGAEEYEVTPMVRVSREGVLMSRGVVYPRRAVRSSVVGTVRN